MTNKISKAREALDELRDMIPEEYVRNNIDELMERIRAPFDILSSIDAERLGKALDEHEEEFRALHEPGTYNVLPILEAAATLHGLVRGEE